MTLEPAHGSPASSAAASNVTTISTVVTSVPSASAAAVVARPSDTPPAAVSGVASKQLRIDPATLPAEALYVIVEGPAPPPGAYFWFNGGYVEARMTGGNSVLRFWPPFAAKPSATLLTLRGPFSRGMPQVDPSGLRIALLPQRVGAGLGLAVGDLYVWSQATGLRRLLATTRRQLLMLADLEWSADGKHLVLMGWANDCPEEVWAGRVETVECERVLLVNAETGRIEYRTPAGLDARTVLARSGRILVMGGPNSQPQETYSGRPGVGTGPSRPAHWYELDAATHTLTPSEPPTVSSPDGRFRVTDFYPKLRVSSSEGKLLYELEDKYLPNPARFRGDHQWQDDEIELDLATGQAQRLWPEGFSAYARSPDGQSALVARTAKGGSVEMRWAKPR